MKYDGLVWYDQNAKLAYPRRFELVLCDGPAVFEHWGPALHAQWRYGLLPALAAQSVSSLEILLEDPDDQRAERMLHRWQAEFGVRYRMIRSADGAYAVVSCRV